MLILYLGAIIVGLLIYVVMRCRINKKRAGNTAALCMKNPPHYHIVQQVPQPKNSTLVYLKGEGHTGEKSAPYLVGLLLIRHNFELSGLTCRKINYMWQACHCPAFRSLLATTINDNKFSWIFMVVFSTFLVYKNCFFLFIYAYQLTFAVWFVEARLHSLLAEYTLIVKDTHAIYQHVRSLTCRFMTVIWSSKEFLILDLPTQGYMIVVFSHGRNKL